MAVRGRYSPEVVDGDFGVLADNFVLVIHVGRGEVDQNVNNEHDVDWGIPNGIHLVLQGIFFFIFTLLLLYRNKKRMKQSRKIAAKV